MQKPYNPAPAESRLKTLQTHFLEAFPPSRRTGLCCWVAKDNTTARMVDALVETETSPGAVFMDLFLHLDKTSAGSDDFAARCADRLRLHLEAEKELLLANDVPEALWTDPPTVWKFSQLLDYAASITATIPSFKGRTVLYLNPSVIEQSRAYFETLREAMQAGLPDGIILMITLPEKLPLVADLVPLDYLGVTVIKPDLDVDGMLQEMITPGPGSPLFSQVVNGFNHLSRLGASGDLAALRTAGDKLVNLTRRRKNLQPVAASAMATVGVFLLGKRAHRGEALSYFRRARTIAEQAIAEGNKEAQPVLVQSLGYEARALFQAKKYGEAAATYRRAAAEHLDKGQEFSRFDHLRLAMESERKNGQPKIAWADGVDAVVALEEIPEGQLTEEVVVNFRAALKAVGRASGYEGVWIPVDKRIGAVLDLHGY